MLLTLVRPLTPTHPLPVGDGAVWSAALVKDSPPGTSYTNFLRSFLLREYGEVSRGDVLASLKRVVDAERRGSPLVWAQSMCVLMDSARNIH